MIMKHLSIFAILALLSTIVYSQTSIRVEGSPTLIDLHSDGTYCYKIDPDNFPKSSEFTLTADETNNEIWEGEFIVKTDSIQLISINGKAADVEIRDGRYYYVINPEDLPTRKQEVDNQDSGRGREK